MLAVRVLMGVVVAAPIVLLVAGSVLLAVCTPLLPQDRGRSALRAIAALTQLAEVLRSKGP